MRLIDADALEKFLWDSNAPEIVKNVMYRMIKEEAPTIDAVEVRHEEWMSYFVGCDIKTVCTNCGEQIPPHYMSHEYCSKCGARMDGRKKEDSNATD